MLTAKEIHIDIDQGLRKVASNVYRKLYPEEIDWAFNKVTERFIASLVTPDKNGSGSFQVNQSKLDDIQNIIESGYELDVFYKDEERGYGVLPSNYMYLVNDKSKILTDCSENFTLSHDVVYNEYISVLKFKDSIGNAGIYYNQLELYINTVKVFDIENYSISAGLTAANEKFVLINLILDVLTKANFKIYWERYKDLYHNESFIIVSNTAVTSSITVDTIIELGINSFTTLNRFTTIYDKVVNNRLLSSSKLNESLYNNVFTKSIQKSPITNLASNYLYFFHTKRLIPYRLIIDYVRKPRKISLILNHSSDLSEQAVRKVTDLTIEYLKLTLESESYNAKVQDNQLRME